MWNTMRQQLRSVIQWEGISDDQLFYRWTDNGDELKNASKLIVGPGQGCIFVYQGEVKAMHVKEGIVSLTTDNVPFWTTIKKFMQGFESEHKVGIYFFRLAKVLDQKWGTSSVIKYVDSVYKFPVGLKAFGNYSYRITNPRYFFLNVLAGQSDYGTADFRSVMSDRIIHPLSDYLAESQYSYNDIDANRNEIASGMAEVLSKEFDKLGFEIVDFRIEGTSFDEDTLGRINRIADITAEAAAAKAAGMDYAQFQHVSALRDAATNEGGGAGVGAGIGAGMAMGQTMMQTPLTSSEPATSSQPAELDIAEKLQKLKSLFDQELISEQEYSDKKLELLAQL